MGKNSLFYSKVFVCWAYASDRELFFFVRDITLFYNSIFPFYRPPCWFVQSLKGNISCHFLHGLWYFLIFMLSIESWSYILRNCYSVECINAFYGVLEWEFIADLINKHFWICPSLHVFRALFSCTKIVIVGHNIPVSYKTECFLFSIMYFLRDS